MKKLAANNLKIWQALTPAPELEEIQNLMPIDPADYERLKADIKKNGFRDPLKVYQKGAQFYIIGGLNRWKIAQELKHRDPLPVDLYQGTAKEYRELAIQDNLNRRHLTAEQKRGLIKYFLKKDPSLSDSHLSKLTKSDRKTIRKKRRELEQGEEIPTLGKVKGTDGKTYKKQQKPTESGTGGTFNDLQRPQGAPEQDLTDLGGVEVRVSLNPYELAALEGIVLQAIKDEYSTPAKKKTLEAIRRKLAQARREG